MRAFALLLCISFASAETAEDVQSFLDGNGNSYPGLGDPAVRTRTLPLLLAALDGPRESRNRAWGLIGNLGPRALPIRDAVIAAFRRLAPHERRYAPANAIGNLGPLAAPLLPEILAAPDRMGLGWPTVLRISPDPGVLVPRLVAEAWSMDRATVIAAADGLASITWCPAVIAAGPALEQALVHWPAAPEMGGKRDAFAVSWQSEPDDPDDAELFARRVTHDTPPDPWPALLALLSEIAPASDLVREAARSHLTAEATAERRQAALAAFTRLEVRDHRDLAAAVAPWLGPGPRGRSAMTVMGRLGAEGRAVLDGLAPEIRDPLIAALVAYGNDETFPLPAAWAAPLIAATKRPSGASYRNLARCGTAGVERMLTAEAAQDARSAVKPDIAAPEVQPAGIVDALDSPPGDRQYAATEMLEAWWYAPWVRTLVAQRRDASTERWILGATALAAADGDAAALAWLRADAGRLRVMADSAPWQLRAKPGLLPADLATPIAEGEERQRAQMRQVVAQHPREELTGLPDDAGLADSLLLARMRWSDGPSVAAWFLERQRHRKEAQAVLLRSLSWQPANQVAWVLYEHRLRLPPAQRERYLHHPDPLVRRMAADW